MELDITNFYENQDILVTGGLGFVGKVLLEKLLRSCSNLKNIFVLIRPKKGKTAENRLDYMLKSELFDLIRKENPLVLKKLIAISGDVSKDNLAISEENLSQMKDISIIFHSAATVRFNETMKDSILINTKGTYEIMKFAETLSCIKSIVHISTAYCNLDRKFIEEKIYPSYVIGWKKILDLAVNNNDAELNELLNSYEKFKHNSYTLSKHYAEQVCNDYRYKLPIVVFRPAIVIPTVSEPCPGWIDNFNGPVGLNIGVGTGVIKTIYADKNVTAEFTPVDISVKVIIVAAAKRYIDSEIALKNDISVYHCSKGVKIGDNIKFGLECVKTNPFEKCIFVPSVIVTNFRYLYLTLFLIFQLLPAAIIDTLLFVLGQKPILLKVQRQIFTGNDFCYNFLSTQWTFNSDETVVLDSAISLKDKDNFSFLNDLNFNMRDFMCNAVVGAKTFLLKEPAKCRKLYLIKYQLQIFFKYLFYGCVLYFVLKLFF